jgi:transposase
MTVVDKNKRRKVRLQYAAGVPTREILERYGICKSTLYNWLDPKKPRRGKVPLRVGRELQDEIGRLNYLGYSDRRIAKMMGLGHGTVSLWRGKLGLPVVKERR